MPPKQIVYTLVSIIILLSVLFGFSIYTNYQKKTFSEDKISKILSKFEEKFKNDSIYLANANKTLIDRISQHILDSISSAYEKKLEVALVNANKYKKLLTENNIDFKHLKNISTQKYAINKTEKYTSKINSINNVTTYSKIKSNLTPKTNNIDNVTTYSKINSTRGNNTTYSNSSNSIKDYKSNVVTYSQLKIKNKEYKTIQNNNSLNSKNASYLNKEKTIIKDKASNKNTLIKAKSNPKNLTHNSIILDSVENLNDVDIAPVYRGCGNLSEKEKKNCFAVKISKHIISNFNKNNIQSIGLKKGINKVRFLFIIDRNGYAKIGKLIGTWPQQIYENVKKAIESTPKMKPGYNKNKPVPIKYSLLISFIIK